MRLPLNVRSLSYFSRNIKEFHVETQPYSPIEPILATQFERIPDQKVNSVLKSNIPPYVYGEDEDAPEVEILYQKHEIEAIRESSSIAAYCIRLVPEVLTVGSTTDHLNDILHSEIVARNAYPSVLGFKNFPKSVSTSVNNVACHGIPDSRPLENGDIVNVDVTVFKNGFHGVCGSTFVIGEVKNNPLIRYLRSASEELMFRGISACQPGKLFLDIGAEISKFARKRHLNIIPNLTGHGIGKYFHSHPYIYHVMNNYPGKLKPGMVFTVCPCITEGNVAIKILEDGLTVITRDHSRTAQFEHTILITEYGAEILSK